MSFRWFAVWGVLLAAPLALFLVLLRRPDWDASFGTLDFHFYVVTSTAMAALIACILIVSRADSLHETRLVFLGLAFLSIAAVFAVHGLDTPGHIHDEVYPELGISTWLSVFLGAVFVSASVISFPEASHEWLERNGRTLFQVVAVGMTGYIGLAIAAPGWLGWLPLQERPLQLAMTGATIGLLGFSAWRYFAAFLFARLPSQWAMVIALVLLAEVQVSMTWGRFWHYSWWEYHALYGLAFAVLFGGWAIEALRAGSLSVIADGLAMRDAVAQLNRGHAQPIAELVEAIETKDLYTLGHVRRVAGFALMVGREMGLSTLDQRNLALAAQMHDIGKIGTPDHILRKPGPLTPEEFSVIKEHSDRGHEIASSIAALRPVADVIRHHHERWDGTGYPLGLQQENIPLHSRIVAVVDAFDAMTSGRVYQAKVSDQAALEELLLCRGTHFDPDCVMAFVRAFERPATAAPAPANRLSDASAA